MRSGLFLLGLGLLSFVAGSPQGGGPGPNGGGGHGGNDDNGGDGDADDGNTSAGGATPTGSASAPAGTSSSDASLLIGMNGGVTCTDLMCIGGLINGSNVQYTLQSLGKNKFGWMAMGFGGTMANTPMVIMWPNSDGSITLSQRHTNAEVMPTVDSNPPRTATKQDALSSLTGTNPKLVFTIPTDSSSQAKSTIIWASASINPQSSAVDATLQQHDNSGPISLDLSQPLTANSRDPTNPVFTLSGSGNSTAGSGSGSGSDTGGAVDIPLQPFQKMIIAHAVLCTVGFLGFLPIGALVARWFRTFTNKWFTPHWIFQLAIAGPVIVAGFACGVSAVHTSGNPVKDTHMKVGIVIFVLYIVQLALGAFVHYVKPTSWTVQKKRPIQNYGHAVLGLLIIALAFYQVRTGYHDEWPKTSGRAPISNAANIVWYIWVVIIPILYFGGLIFLPRQYKQERGTVKSASSSEAEGMNMPERHSENRY